MKGGFCFFDTNAFNLSLPGAPTSAAYAPGSVCAQNNQSASSLRMGISVGWGDRYGSLLRDQYIDVPNLTSGNYRLSATADLAGPIQRGQRSEQRDLGRSQAPDQ